MFPDLTRDDVFRIETRRLWLRWPKVQDAAAIKRLAASPVVAEMTGIVPHPYPEGEAERFVFEQRKRNATGERLSFAVAPRNQPHQFVGWIGSRALPGGPNGTGRCSLGYWLGEGHWGQGYATEAAHGLIDAVFSFTEMQEIEASARVINPASRRILEKCGFQFVTSQMMELPQLRGAVPVDTFVLSRSIWESLKDWRSPRVEIDRHAGRGSTADDARERVLAPCA
jgi:RimJ/RimL family protein N-acetyltransferase